MMSAEASPIEFEPSWSETTTPTSDDLNKETPRAAHISQAAKRVQRKPSVRRRGYRPSISPCNLRIVETSEFPERYSILNRQALEVSPLAAFDIDIPKSLPHATALRPCGFIESEEVDDERVNQAMEDAMMISRDDSEELEGLLEPKIESPEGLVGMDDVDEIRASQRSPQSAGSSLQAKRPRGRPRKHPVPSLENLAKVAKGRSKTGCITCRKRKKKCDEAKPRCMNCEKNAVLCEGYPERTIWKSGRERAEEAQLRRVSLPNITLQPVIHGVETSGDRIFFEHYVFRLSTVLTVEGPRKNAFKDMLLPMAVQHLGLMHSILALSSSNIDYQAPYGKALLAKYPDVTESRLQLRAQFHQDEAMKEFNLDIRKQQAGAVEEAILSARYGQMLCLVVQSIAEGRTTGEHRIHLQAYQALMQESPPEEGPFMEFIREYFQFHIAADELICLPENSSRITEDDDDSSDWKIPSVIQPEAMRMIGVQDGLFFFMSKITNIRNMIRIKMSKGVEPVVDYTSLYRAAEIDAGIRDWKPSWPEGDRRDLAGMLYKQMMWVYLWRTIYPPKTTAWRPDPKITQAVNDGLVLLGMFEPSDPTQTVLLAPAFIIGCAAFNEEQRGPIRKSIKTVREYASLKNADRALEVLEEVWRFMDEKDERSWDWQSIAHGMGMDFLAT